MKLEIPGEPLQWQAVSYDRKTKKLVFPNHTDESFVETSLPEKGSGRGWLFRRNPNRAWMAIQIGDSQPGSGCRVFIKEKPFIDSQGPLITLQQACLLSLCRLLYHDFNGKIMGLSGIVGMWKSQFPTAADSAEDITLIEEGLQFQLQWLQLLNLISLHAPASPPLVNLQAIQPCLVHWLSRCFTPANRFVFTYESSLERLTVEPSAFILSLWTTSLVLALFQKSGEWVRLHLTTYEELPQPVLRMSLECPAFRAFLMDPSASLIPSSVTLDHWLFFFAHHGGSLRAAENNTLIMELPLTPMPLPHATPSEILGQTGA